MSGSVYGTIFKISTWGESHGAGVGVVVDGCPAGLPLNEEDIQKYLDRRKPGQSKFTTARSEGDKAEILSGVFEGKTTGTPISIVIRNTDQRSRDYSNIMDVYRPGHADYTFDEKYGFRDYRGGGRSSGRETIGRVAAGAVAAKLLESLGITVQAYTSAVGPVKIDHSKMDLEEISNNRLYMPDKKAAAEAESYLEDMIQRKDSCGGVIECVVNGLPAGVGEPVFDKLDAALGKAIMSIGAVKGKDGRPCKVTNHSGGTLGGMSDGSTLVMRAAFKPTPSISQIQKTVDRYGKEREIEIKGRHDPVIVPRAVVVVEAMAALTVADLLLMSMTSRLDKIKKFFKKEEI